MATKINDPATTYCLDREKQNKKLDLDERMPRCIRGNKTLMAQDTLLVYPKYGEPFDVHTDASNLQIGGIVSQNVKPIAFSSKNY